MQVIDKDLRSIQEARILVESARDAQLLLKEYSQKDLDRIVQIILTGMQPLIPQLIQEELAEIPAGVQADKQQLAERFLTQLQVKLTNEKVVGILQEKLEGPIEAIGVSLGVVAVILPPENIFLNALYATLIGLKAGNAVLLVPQPRTETVVANVYRKIDKLAQEAGLPQGTLSCMSSITDQGIATILGHPDTAMVIDIGCPSCFDSVESINKPMIYGGTGSTPVFIERTANINQAAEAVVQSRGFDNGLLPAAEQFVIAEGVIAQEVKAMMIQAGAHFMKETEEIMLVEHLFTAKDQVNPLCIGKSATWLAGYAGFEVPPKTKVLVSEQPYIFDENPFTNELRCPVLTFYLEPDWIHACEKCIQLLKDKKNGHTLAIHSNDQQVIREFALKKPVGRMIVNAPASFSSIGLDSTLPLSLILGGLTTGRGYTAKNITASDLTYQRSIGYQMVTVNTGEVKPPADLSDQELLAKLLTKIMERPIEEK